MARRYVAFGITLGKAQAFRTIGEFIAAVLAIDTADAARQFFETHVAAGMAPEVLRKNIGWCFGEGMARERIAMWRAAVDAEHPTLPHIEDKTPEEIFQAGFDLGREIMARRG